MRYRTSAGQHAAASTAGTAAPASTVYIVNADAAARARLQRMLQAPGRTLRSLESAAAFLAEGLTDQPGCLLLDLQADGGGLALQQRLQRRRLPLPLVFISADGEIGSAVRAMRAGAIDVLTLPLRTRPLRAAVARALARDAAQRAQAAWLAGLRRRHASLTPRERQVMALVMDGLMNKQAAQALAISEISVKVHRGNMMRKMAAANLIELVRIDLALHPRAPWFNATPLRSPADAAPAAHHAACCGARRPDCARWPA